MLFFLEKQDAKHSSAMLRVIPPSPGLTYTIDLMSKAQSGIYVLSYSEVLRTFTFQKAGYLLGNRLLSGTMSLRVK